MQYKSNKGMTGWAQLGLLFVLVGAGLVFGTLIQVIVSLGMLPEVTSIKNTQSTLLKAMQDPKNTNTFRWLQFISTFFIFFIPSYVYSRMANGKEWIWMGFSKYINLHQGLLGFLIMFTVGALGGYLQQISKWLVSFAPNLDIIAQKMESFYNDQILAMSHISGTADFFIVLVIMAFLPAVFEELFFRGVVQNLLEKWWKKPFLAIIITAVLFSFIHNSIYLFLTRAIMGFALGYMYYITRNVWTNIAAHFINNAMAAIQMLVLSRNGEQPNLNEMDVNINWWQSILAAAILIFLFHLLEKYSVVNRMKIHNREESLKVNYPEGHPIAGPLN